MPFDFRQLAEIEAQTRRVLGGARTINPQLRNDAVEFILAEVRHAGQTMCDPNSTQLARNSALLRLVDQLFAPNPPGAP